MQTEEDPKNKFQSIMAIKETNLVNQTRAFQELVMFMEYKIRNEFKSFSLFAICGSERTKFMVDIYFESAFSNLSLNEKIQLYHKTINNAVEIQNISTMESEVEIELEEEEEDQNQTARFKIDVEEGFHSWKSRFLTIEGFKIKSNQIHFDIRNYLLRKSKKKDKDCYVLEAIHQSKPQVLRFCFLTNQDQKKYLPKIEKLINIGYKEEIKRMYNIQILKSQSKKKTVNSQTPLTESQFKEKKTQQKQNSTRKRKLTLKTPIEEEQEPVEFVRNQSHVVEEFIKHIEEQDASIQINSFVENQNQKYQEHIKEKVKCKQKTVSYKNIFNIMFPNFHITDLDHFEQYKVATTDQQTGCFVFQHLNQANVFKLEVILKLKPELVLMVLTNPRLFKNWHPEIVQAEIKLNILSENSAIVYQKHKAYSKWYRERDFIFLRHVFKVAEDYYIADKSIENINYIPFSTIQRGQINYQIAKISPSATGSKLIIELNMDHRGLLNRSYANEMTCNYLNGFQKMEGYFCIQEFEKKLESFFYSEWVIKEQRNSSLTLKKQATSQALCDVEFKSEEISQINDSDVFFSIQDQDQNLEDKVSVHELQSPRETQIKAPIYEGEEQIKLNEEGLVILPQKYLEVRHPTGIITQLADKRSGCPWENRILRDHWKLKKDGALVLTHKKVIEAQNSVLSFMMSTFKKKIFSKENVTISLPVTIFNSNSQLSQYAESLRMAPLYLEQAAKMIDPVERLKRVMILGLSQSILFLDINKPFNPILGETYQSYIGGCPFYAEQISHHPPITSYLYLGRGYKIQATLEATVNIHLNSADGINVGWSHVIFDDGQEVCFHTPPAQFSGFAMGDREFNFKSKGYYYDEGNNLFSEMFFEDQAGIFSSNKWKFVDQVEAVGMSVSSQFLSKFIREFKEKKHSPGKKDILQRHFKIQGRWPLSITVNGQQIYDPTNDAPFENVPYQYPLNSNTNYREDLYYRKIQDLSRSQSEKQRLENIQRADRKFRQKYHGKAH